MTTRLVRSWIVRLAVVALLAGAAPGPARAAQQWNYPGCTSAPDTLESCVAQASPGDSIEINTNAPIQEFVTVDRNLTIFGGSGFHASVLGIGAYGDGSQGAVDITVRDLSLSMGLIANFVGGSGHRFTADRVSIDPGVLVFHASVASTFVVKRSTMHWAGDETSAIELVDEHPSGLVTLSVIGNRVSGNGNASSGSGIELLLEGSGSTRADILGNSIWDVARCNCGNVAGILIDAQGAVRADVNVIGNTLDLVHTVALRVDNGAPVDARISVDAFDNVFSHAGSSAIDLESDHPSTLKFRAGYNDFFHNGGSSRLEEHALGPGNLHKAPGYVKPSSGDLRLRSTSPLLDMGLVCTPGGLANLDAAGHGRLAGRSVDMGAYERGAGRPTGKAFVGTSGSDQLTGTHGADIMCGYGGPDDLNGSSGADYVDGGTGKDVLVGGGGPDRIFGREGNDTLCARDGVHNNDRLDGGPGTDGSKSDQGDVVTHVEHSSACT